VDSQLRSVRLWAGKGITHKLVFLAGDVGHIHIVSGRAKLFQLLTSEDVNRDKVDLGVAMFPSLGGRHIDNFAGTVFNNNETVLPQGRALHGVSSRCTRISGVERVLMLCRRADKLEFWWLQTRAPTTREAKKIVSQGGAGAGRQLRSSYLCIIRHLVTSQLDEIDG
jgi:hypothetical protein